MANRYSNIYTSYGGADAVALFNGTVIGTLKGIAWSITREKGAVYTMGSANPRSFTRGKRGIAGTFQFSVFDRDSLTQLISNDDSMQIYKRVSEWTNEIYNLPAKVTNAWWEQQAGVLSGTPFYNDEIPPFDVTISFVNEYGNQSRKDIFGVEILNEGSGISMDSIVIDETMTFVARAISKMEPTTAWTVTNPADAQ